MPASAPVPAVKVTPIGNVPVTERVGAGVPVAVTVKVLADKTLNVVALALVICGATAAALGVTMTVPDAPLVPVPLVPGPLVAVTEQV